MADVNKRMNNCAFADARAVFNIHVRRNCGAGADCDVAADDRVGSDADVGAQFCTGVNDGCWMNEGASGIEVGVEMRSFEEEVEDHFAHRALGFWRIENGATSDEFAKLIETSLHSEPENKRRGGALERLFEEMRLGNKYDGTSLCFLGGSDAGDRDF